MNKCSCKVCDLGVFENSDKCILHCEKNGWIKPQEFPPNSRSWDPNKVKQFWEIIRKEYTYNEKLKYLLFPHRFQDIIFPKFEGNGLASKVSEYQNSFFKQNDKEIFTVKAEFLDCTFLDSVGFDIGFEKTVYFEKCKFEDTLNIYLDKFAEKLTFKDCHFYKKINIYRNSNSPVRFDNCNFYDNDLDLSNKIFFKSFSFENNKSIKAFSVENSIFHSTSSFKKTTFNKISLLNTSFEKLVSFSDVRFNLKIDFENTIFKDESNFLNIKNKVGQKIESKNIENRETARIIKHSFEKQDNIIEANKFYALEMKEREKELSWGKNFFEKLVFTLHGMSSDHSQSWLLALFWIINLSFITSFLGETFSNEISTLIKIDRILVFYGGLGLLGYFISQLEKIRDWLVVVFSFCIYLVYENYSNDKDLACFSKTLNPFSIMRGDEPITFGGLIYKIIIAYLIYQLIISIRQNTRRK